MLFIWRLARRPILLATKQDLCETCATVTTHWLLRIVSIFELYFVPVAPVWVSHRLTCERCLTTRKLTWRQARWALRHGRLELPPRPTFPAYARSVFDETGRMPQERDLEPVVKNLERGRWDLFVRAWLVVVPSLIVGLIVVQQIP